MEKHTNCLQDSETHNVAVIRPTPTLYHRVHDYNLYCAAVWTMKQLSAFGFTALSQRSSSSGQSSTTQEKGLGLILTHNKRQVTLAVN